MLGCGWPNDEEENHGNPAHWTFFILKFKMLYSQHFELHYITFHYKTINNVLKKGFLSKWVVDNLIITLFKNTINSFKG